MWAGQRARLSISSCSLSITKCIYTAARLDRAHGGRTVKITEVGLRDGLQGLTTPLPLPVTLQALQALLDSGLRSIEIGAFVSPTKIPAMRHTPEIFKALTLPALNHCTTLVPNARGAQQALDCGARGNHLNKALTSQIHC